MKKYPWLFLVMLMPYVVIVTFIYFIFGGNFIYTLTSEINAEIIIGIVIAASMFLMYISTVSAIVTAIYFYFKKKPSEEILRIIRMTKIMHIPVYALTFLLPFLWKSFLWKSLSIYAPINMGVPIIVGIFLGADLIAVFFTGIIGLVGVIRSYQEHNISKKAAVINGMLQFVFCADIFSAVWVYKKVKEEEKINEEVL